MQLGRTLVRGLERLYGARELAGHVEFGPDDVQGPIPPQGVTVHLEVRIGTCLKEGDGLRPFRWDPLVDWVTIQQPFQNESGLVGTHIVYAVHVNRRWIRVIYVQNVGGWHFQFSYFNGTGCGREGDKEIADKYRGLLKFKLSFEMLIMGSDRQKFIATGC